MTVATKLSEARKLIERGWCRNTLARRGRVCAAGAIYSVFGEPTTLSPHCSELYEAFEFLRRAIGNNRYIGEWNDEQPSKKPVIEAFKRAEQLARDSAE